jgi:hypothetical protein
MDRISTVIIVRELHRRLYNFRVKGEYDTFFSAMCDIDEPSVVDFDNALTNMLDIYDEDATLRMVNTLEECEYEQ